MNEEITNQEENLTNQEFADTNEYFRNCCKRASEIIGREVIPTHSQASKFRNKRGMAYMWGRGRKPL